MEDKQPLGAVAQQVVKNMKAPNLVPEVRTQPSKRAFKSNKITCRFCEYFTEYTNSSKGNGHCSLKNSTVRSTKRRACKSGKLDTIRFTQAEINRSAAMEEKPLVVWKQTEAYYERQYNKPWHNRKKNDNPGDPI